MPAILHFTVTEERTVEVSANDPVEAIQIAKKAFEDGQKSNKLKDREGLGDIVGNTVSRVRTRELSVRGRD